ncbi:MAG: SGNH/GDSL hydrolase family protein [Deinococcota bacterium]
MVTLFIACDTTNAEANETSSILVLGDSIMEWNVEDEASIPDIMAQILDREVVNAAVSGARVSHPDSEAAAEGFDIRRQYLPDAWAWVVLDGGANDLGDECNCGECGQVLDELISADGRSGEIPSFILSLTKSNHQIMYVGYYDAPTGGGFEQCQEEFVVLNGRVQTMAESLEDVFYISAGDVIDASNLELFDDDLIHPSIFGSDLIGEYIAETIKAIELD